MNVFKNPLLKKYLIIALVTILGVVLAGCMGPQFTYQGVLTDASGNPVSGTVNITYRIFNAVTGGTALHSESESVTLADGRFDSVVGPTGVAGGLSPKDLAQPLWIELQIGNGTITETLTPRQRLYGAPYAFTLMPGTVISSTMNETLHGAGGIEAIVSVYNMETADPIPALQVVGNTVLSSPGSIPALRVVGDRGIELVDVSGSEGTLYSDMDSSSDIAAYVTDDFLIRLDTDHDEYGAFIVYGDGTDWCRFNDSGDLDCTGSKSSVTDIDGELRALYAIESPDVWFEDFGSAQLVAGVATVQVDALFAQTVNLDVEYHVFITPLGDCNGLYVTNKTATGFEVHELDGGTSSVSFDYRIIAKRVGYEDIHLEVVNMDVDGEGQ